MLSGVINQVYEYAETEILFENLFILFENVKHVKAFDVQNGLENLALFTK